MKQKPAVKNVSSNFSLFMQYLFSNYITNLFVQYAQGIPSVSMDYNICFSEL